MWSLHSLKLSAPSCRGKVHPSNQMLRVQCLRHKTSVDISEKPHGTLTQPSLAASAHPALGVYVCAAVSAVEQWPGLQFLFYHLKYCHGCLSPLVPLLMREGAAAALPFPSATSACRCIAVWPSNATLRTHNGRKTLEFLSHHQTSFWLSKHFLILFCFFKLSIPSQPTLPSYQKTALVFQM